MGGAAGTSHGASNRSTTPERPATVKMLTIEISSGSLGRYTTPTKASIKRHLGSRIRWVPITIYVVLVLSRELPH